MADEQDLFIDQSLCLDESRENDLPVAVAQCASDNLQLFASKFSKRLYPFYSSDYPKHLTANNLDKFYEWESTRRELLWKLNVMRTNLNKIYKLGHFRRLVTCALQNFCMVIPFLAKVGTSFGIIGVASIIYEANASKTIYYDLVKLIQRDQYLFTPIKKYFHQNEETVLEIFDRTNAIMGECFDITEVDDFNSVKSFASPFEDTAIQDETQLQNQSLTRNMINCVSSSFKELYEWISFSGHPDIQDAKRMIAHSSSSSIRYLIFQSVKALVPVDLRWNSFFVLWFMGLNTVCAIDIVYEFLEPVPRESELLILEKQLEMELRILKIHITGKKHVAVEILKKIYF